MYSKNFLEIDKILELINARAQIDEKDQSLETEKEARRNERRELEKFIAKLKSEVEAKNEEIESLNQTTAHAKESYNRLKQQMIALEQKTLQLDLEVQEQREEKENLRR